MHFIYVFIYTFLYALIFEFIDGLIYVCVYVFVYVYMHALIDVLYVCLCLSFEYVGTLGVGNVCMHATYVCFCFVYFKEWLTYCFMYSVLLMHVLMIFNRFTHIHACIYECAYAYLYLLIVLCIYARMQFCKYVCIYVHMHSECVERCVDILVMC